MTVGAGRVLVTGASSGIGLATARLLRAHGYDVLGTSRSPRPAGPDGVPLLRLDLDDPDAARALIAETGPVDVLVCNAGESMCGPLEDVPLAALDRLFRVNVLGHAALVQQVVPGMRARGDGRIVMIGSMHASFPVAFRSGYAASKAALRTMADCLRAELAPDGIGVSTVEPGSIRTGISARRTVHIGAGTPRAQAFERFLEALDGKERAGIEPERVADAVVRAVRSARPRRLYAVAPGAGLTYGLRRVLPDRVVEGLVARAHGLGAAHWESAEQGRRRERRVARAMARRRSEGRLDAC